MPYYVYKGLGFFDADEVKDVMTLVQCLAAPDAHLHVAAFLRSRFVRLSDRALKQLAPHVAEALGAAEPPAAMAALSAEDQRVLRLARESFARWRRLADRLAPAELIDQVLHESAYAWELRGRGHAQARENLKKLRSLVRRLQNRGYATLARIAERINQLMSGDESNAIVDALDAVNLMTVHAAKGLEFPVVFVVNLSRGTGGRGDAIDVVTRVDGDGALTDLVSIDGLADEPGQELEAREREESKRLVYVALTRARDRLYLGTTLSRQGAFAPASTSLGAVLPASLGAALAAAALGSEGTIEWRTASGRVHALRVVTAEGAIASTGTAPSAAIDDFGRLVPAAGEPARLTEVTAGGPVDGPSTSPAPATRAVARAVGTLVHEAIAAGALVTTAERRALLVDEAGLGHDAGTRAAARRGLEALASRADVAALISGSHVQHEVPVSVCEPDGTIVRAVVDMIVHRPDGVVVVAEFKTGAPRPADDRQLAAYAAGIKALVPGSIVQTRMIRVDL